MQRLSQSKATEWLLCTLYGCIHPSSTSTGGTHAAWKWLRKVSSCSKHQFSLSAYAVSRVPFAVRSARWHMQSSEKCCLSFKSVVETCTGVTRLHSWRHGLLYGVVVWLLGVWQKQVAHVTVVLNYDRLDDSVWGRNWRGKIARTLYARKNHRSCRRVMWSMALTTGDKACLYVLPCMYHRVHDVQMSLAKLSYHTARLVIVQQHDLSLPPGVP